MLSELAKEFITKNAQNMTINELCNHLQNKYSSKEIRSFCYRKGISIKKLSKSEWSALMANRKYSSYNATKINHNYFKCWSKNMAYILGFWFADGNICKSSGGYYFDITVKQEDKYLLEEFLKEFASEHKIYDKSKEGCCHILFSCKEFYNDIIALGGKERKSLTLTFPDVPEEYLSHFIRGYFDGDGCIYKSRYAAYLISTKEFCEKLKEILLKEGITPSSIKQKHPENGIDNNCYTLNIFHKDEFIKFAKYLYKDVDSSCIVMSRKDMRKRLASIPQEKAVSA